MKGDPDSTLPMWLFDSSIGGVGRVQMGQAAVSLAAFLETLQGRVEALRSELCSYLRGMGLEGISCMVRGKNGFTPEEAKRLFYSFRRKKRETPEDVPGPNKPDDTEARFEKIMVYMEETSKKLDRIESDIEFLKQQVASILKRL